MVLGRPRVGGMLAASAGSPQVSPYNLQAPPLLTFTRIATYQLVIAMTVAGLQPQPGQSWQHNTATANFCVLPIAILIAKLAFAIATNPDARELLMRRRYIAQLGGHDGAPERRCRSAPKSVDWQAQDRYKAHQHGGPPGAQHKTTQPRFRANFA